MGFAEWRVALALNEARSVVSGSHETLVDAIRCGADLRVATSFRHDEHMQPGSDRRELVQEVADFRLTYLIENRWAAGIITLRQPIDIPHGFGPRPSMSFFLYNQDGQQAIARPYLDGVSPMAEPGPAAPAAPSDMPKYHIQGGQDEGTNAPSHHFVYDFDHYRFHVRDSWKQLYAHDEQGRGQCGSLDALVAAFNGGAELKVAIRGLCRDLTVDGVEGEQAMDHEVFVHLGSCYYYTESKYLMAGSHPLVRVAPAIPLVYRCRGWDFGWVMPRTDGFMAKLLYDPYTLVPHKSEGQYAMRWFAQSL